MYNNSVVHLFASSFSNSTTSMTEGVQCVQWILPVKWLYMLLFSHYQHYLPQASLLLCNSCPKYFRGYHFLQNRILASPLVRRDFLALQLWIQLWVAASSRFPASLGEGLVISVKKTTLYSLKCHGLIVSPSNRDSLFLEGHINPSSRGHMWILSSMYINVMSCSHSRRAEWLN